MPVSGIVVTCFAGCADDVAGHMAALDSVDVHEVLPDGQIIAVVEAETIEGEVDIFTALHDLAGVQTVRLAYHNFEDV